MIFDLDGTLVQTERLKAQSYADAAAELCEWSINEQDVIDAFVDVVGLSRREVATHLVDRFNLTQEAMALAPSLGVTTAWQAYVQLRLRYYEDMISDPAVILSNTWPHNIELLELARRTRCKTALATMSHCEQATLVLDTLQLKEQFDFVATRDDVSNGKPDPEIYQLVAAELGSDPSECLVIEDSPAGVKAAHAAGMSCIGVPSDSDHPLLEADHQVASLRQLL